MASDPSPPTWIPEAAHASLARRRVHSQHTECWSWRAPAPLCQARLRPARWGRWGGSGSGSSPPPSPRHPLRAPTSLLFSPLLLCFELEGWATEAQGEGKPWQEKHRPPRPSGSGEARASWSQEWDERGHRPQGSPTHPASQKPSPGLEPEPSGPHPSRCPRPGGRGRGWGESPTSWATRLEMRTARLTRPFWALGCRAPVLLAFPAGAAMEDLAPPSLPARGPEGPASASPAAQRQLSPGCAPGAGGLAPRAASGTKPGSLGLGLGAGVTLAVSVDSSPPGSGCPWPRGAGPAARVPHSARCQPSSGPGTAVGASAPPAGPSSSQVPTPAPTPGSLAPPAGQRPPPPRPAPGSCCSHSRSPCPSPSPAARPVTAD